MQFLTFPNSSLSKYFSASPLVSLPCIDQSKPSNIQTPPPQPGLHIPNGSVVRMMDFGPGLESIPHGVITIDYGVVLEGEFRLTLDSGESRILRRGDVLIQRATSHKWENISGGGTECGRMLFVLLGCKDVVVGGKKIEADLGVLEKEYAREEKTLQPNGHSVVNGDSAMNGNSAVNGNSAPNGASKTSGVGFEEVRSRTQQTPLYSKLISTSVVRPHEQ